MALQFHSRHFDPWGGEGVSKIGGECLRYKGLFFMSLHFSLLLIRPIFTLENWQKVRFLAPNRTGFHSFLMPEKFGGEWGMRLLIPVHYGSFFLCSYCALKWGYYMQSAG
jgi:hypothetical protein